MVKNIVDQHVRRKLEETAQSLNQRTKHNIGIFMRDGLTGYGECQRVPCRAGFNVGYLAGLEGAEPVVTDNTAEGTPCPSLLT